MRCQFIIFWWQIPQIPDLFVTLFKGSKGQLKSSKMVSTQISGGRFSVCSVYICIQRYTEIMACWMDYSSCLLMGRSRDELSYVYSVQPAAKGGQPCHSTAVDHVSVVIFVSNKYHPKWSCLYILYSEV